MSNGVISHIVNEIRQVSIKNHPLPSYTHTLFTYLFS